VAAVAAVVTVAAAAAVPAAVATHTSGICLLLGNARRG